MATSKHDPTPRGGARTHAEQRAGARGFTGDDDRWSAVARRDPAADGAFVYAVRTTGVYCRPGCGSRRPRRENVRFFAGAAEAEAAGFRACRRCRPEGPAAPAGRWTAEVVRACRLIDSADEPPSLNALAAAVGMSRYHFHRVFRATLGLTPRAYAAGRTARRAREELRRSDTVTQAVYAAGFRSSGRFYAAAPGMLGMTPSSFRRGGRGETIRFAVGACTLGAVLVAATPRGVCAIDLGDDPQALVRELRDRFPNARLVGGEPGFARWVAAVVCFVEAPAGHLDLPLDVRGTAFQQRVWRALLDIPPGSTATYSEIARRIGPRSAARAAGRACAANPLAVAIPCHRVVRRDGSLAGYRWGIDRKRLLLEREALRAGPPEPGAGDG